VRTPRLYTSRRIRRHGRECSENNPMVVRNTVRAQRDSPRKDPHRLRYVVKFCVFK